MEIKYLVVHIIVKRSYERRRNHHIRGDYYTSSIGVSWVITNIVAENVDVSMYRNEHKPTIFRIEF